MKKSVTRSAFFLLTIQLVFLIGCSMDATLSPINVAVDLPDVGVVDSLNRTDPDFVSAEMVTVSSPSGPVIFKGSFGDITTEVQMPSGHRIEGVFYQ